MKSFTLLLLVICCTSLTYETAALRKVTASVTVTGLTKEKITAEAAKLRSKLATLLDIDLDDVKLEEDAPAAATTPAAVSAAPTTAAPTAAATTAAATTTAGAGRRLAATTTFTFSVVVGTDAEAKKLMDTLKSDKFKTDLLKAMKEIFVDDADNLDVTVSNKITNEEYVPTTTASGKVSGTTRTVVSSVALSHLLLFLSMAIFQ